MLRMHKRTSELVAESLQGGGEFGDGFQEQVGFGDAETFFCGEWAEDGDGGSHSGAASHLQIFGRVADVNGIGCAQTHVAERETERGGMRFAKARVPAADAGGEMIPQAEFTQLTVDAIAITACDQTQRVGARE